jgi:hypothetical protein
LITSITFSLAVKDMLYLSEMLTLFHLAGLYKKMTSINISRELKAKFEKERFLLGEQEQRKVFSNEFMNILLKTWKDVKNMEKSAATPA